MAKPNPTAKAVSTEASPEPGDTLVHGEFTGEIPAHMSTDTPRIDPGALINTLPDLVSARVLCAVTIGADEYQPDDVIEGLPAVLAEQYAGSIDAHPDAVDHALFHGAKPKQFTTAE